MSPFQQDMSDLADAGIDLLHTSLELTKPIVSPYTLHPAELHLEKEPEPTLWWREGNAPRHIPTMPNTGPVDRCLTEFVRLHHATDEQIYTFARRWGILGLWPMRKEDPVPDGNADDMWSMACRQDRLWYGETTDFWRRMARRGRSLLLIAAALYQKKLPSIDLWEEVIVPYQLHRERERWSCQRRSVADATPISEVEAQGRTLLWAVSLWTKNAPLFLQLEWRERETGVMEDVPRVRLEANGMPTNWEENHFEMAARQRIHPQKWDLRGFDTYRNDYPYVPMRSSALFNILVVQLVAALTSPLYPCDVCGEPCAGGSKRKPQATRAKLCSEKCRRKRASERGSKHYAAKKASRLN